MTTRRLGTVTALVAGLGLSGAAQAALYDRGGGLIYDSVLDLTWLRNANYAATELTDARRDAIISAVNTAPPSWLGGHTMVQVFRAGVPLRRGAMSAVTPGCPSPYLA